MILKSPQQIQAMREGGKILAEVLHTLAQEARPGMTTQDLEDRAQALLLHHNVESSFLGYRNFPAALCTSINEEAVHGIPSDRKLVDGDLLKIDFGVYHEGLHTDAAITVLIGESAASKEENKEKLKLIRVTREALYAGIQHAKIGNAIGDISTSIQEVIEKNGLKIMKELGGHGIGEVLHDEPFVANFGEAGYGPELVEGMALAIEPITTAGNWRMKDGKDGFAYVTKDSSPAAHFEHTIIITKDGPLVVTEYQP